MTDLASTTDLLRRAREGDAQALDDLIRRHQGPLRRWARGRLPRWTRDLRDTEDLVQETLAQTLRHIKDFEPRHEGALQAYLRQALINRVARRGAAGHALPDAGGDWTTRRSMRTRPRRRSTKRSATRPWIDTKRRCSACVRRSAK